ncbi:MAG: PVC-type heme-binding CxxCH protein, partial [Singulisphaera sp.]
ASAGGYTPEEARARMVVPEGFHVEVFASEPMVRQPVTACFDERGRAWVIEYLQYPNPAGLKPVKVDQYLRTEYDRFPDPPPRGPRGADRIKILEDTDGDGKADKATVFVEGLNLASGLAVGHGGVFVGQAPYLLFYPDANKDDTPDGDPKVLLSGFGMQDAHATVNSMQWGPDGWLYGAQGSTVTARIRGHEFQQGIWRYHPRTDVFELFAEGGGNTWGLDFDKAGNAFGSSNGSYIVFHMVQGGYYVKGFAKHGPLHNRNTFGYFLPVEYRGKKAGGHVTPGGILYKGDAYPANFRDAFIGGNLLSNTAYWHKLEGLGSTFAGRHGGTLVDARDTWFRPIDQLLGPDASVYVVDWYDRRASHLDPRDNWDKSNGRIYRVVYGERRKVPPFDLSKLPSHELVALRAHANDWFAAEARRILAERRDPSVLPALKASLQAERDEVRALRDLWALYVSGGLDDSTALGLLDHAVAGVRRWTVRLLGDEHRMSTSLLASLVELGQNEPDSRVRSQLASSCQRWDRRRPCRSCPADASGRGRLRRASPPDLVGSGAADAGRPRRGGGPDRLARRAAIAAGARGLAGARRAVAGRSGRARRLQGLRPALRRGAGASGDRPPGRRDRERAGGTPPRRRPPRARRASGAALGPPRAEHVSRPVRDPAGEPPRVSQGPGARDRLQGPRARPRGGGRGLGQRQSDSLPILWTWSDASDPASDGGPQCARDLPSARGGRHPAGPLSGAARHPQRPRARPALQPQGVGRSPGRGDGNGEDRPQGPASHAGPPDRPARRPGAHRAGRESLGASARSRLSREGPADRRGPRHPARRRQGQPRAGPARLPGELRHLPPALQRRGGHRPRADRRGAGRPRLPALQPGRSQFLRPQRVPGPDRRAR